jgi:hypothetical protein
MKLEERLFVVNSRMHSPFANDGYRNRENRFPEHLEIKDLQAWLEKNVKCYDKVIREHIENLQPNGEKIKFIDDLNDEVISAIDDNPDLSFTLPGKVNYNIEHGEVTSPLGVLNQYETESKRAIFLIEELGLRHPYFLEIKGHSLENLSLIEQIKDETKTEYSLRADFTVQIKKIIKPKWERQPNGLYGYSKTKKATFYEGELLVVHDLHTVEKINEIVKSFPKDLKDKEFSLLNTRVYASELVSGTIKQAANAAPHSWNLKDGDEFTVHAVVNMEQTNYTKFEHSAQFHITRGNKEKNHRVTMTGSMGYPFQGAILDRQSRIIAQRVKKLTNRIDSYNHVFQDLTTLYNLANVNIFLRSKGATRAKQSITGKELIVAKNMSNPYMVLNGNKGKPVIPNDVDITTEKNVLVATGANMNGKTVHGITHVQNLVFAQANLYVFADEMIYTPIDKIVAIFGDYKGNTDKSQSKHSMDCKQLHEGLIELTKNTYFMPDETGTGTDPEGGAQLAYETWEQLAKTSSVIVYIPTHYKDKAAEFFNKCSNVQAIAFDLDKDKMPTYKSIPGKIALSSEAAIIAEQFGVDKTGLEKISSQWELNGIPMRKNI